MGTRHRNSTRKGAGARRNIEATPELAARYAKLLADRWPQARCELDHDNAYQLLVATILSAQSTDKTINTVTPALFAKFPDATALAAADQGELEVMVHKTGFFRMKAKHLIGMARAVVERHGGQIPATMPALVELPGVARKTANVVLGTAMGKNEGIVVDTHVSRVAARLGLTENTDPNKIEQDLMKLVPRDQWTSFAHRVILHGRYVCLAQKPDCEHCSLAPLCPSAGTAAIIPISKGKPGARSVAKRRAKPPVKPAKPARKGA